jgi:hypothetical protein
LKKSVYIESSIIGYLTARPSADVVKAGRQAVTIKWWTKRTLKFDAYISRLVEREIASGDPTAADLRMKAVLDLPRYETGFEAQELAKLLISSKAVPANSVEDALHIAIAATNGAEFLLTWNFKHINNAETKRFIEEVIQRAGYQVPILCSPEELGVDND